MAEKKKSRQQVFTLLVEVGRNDGDGLPKGATGGALMVYASGIDEAEAPLVKMTSLGLAPIKLATCSRATSTECSASHPNAWVRLWGFP